MIESGYFLNAIKRDIEMIRGDTLSFAFQVQGLKGQEPTKVQFSCKESLEDTAYLFAVSLADTIDIRSYDSTSDTFTYVVRVPPEKTEGVEPGRYYYDLELYCNGDVITLMIGRIQLDDQVTEASIPPPIEYGDSDEYPFSIVQEGLQKIYTVLYISNIAKNIRYINGSTDTYNTQEMSAALEDIRDNIDDIVNAINSLTGSTSSIPLSSIAATITNELDKKYENGMEVYY